MSQECTSIEFRPRHRLFVAFEGAAAASAAEEELRRRGISSEVVWRLAGKQGADCLDLSGRAHGLWGRAVRVIQHALSSDYEYLESLDWELRHDHVVLAVPVDSIEGADELARALMPFGGHDIGYFVHWNFEPVAA